VGGAGFLYNSGFITVQDIIIAADNELYLHPYSIMSGFDARQFPKKMRILGRIRLTRFFARFSLQAPQSPWVLVPPVEAALWP